MRRTVWLLLVSICLLVGGWGLGGPIVRATSGQVSEIIAKVSSYEGHNIVLKTDGTVWTWGRNAHGELGDGTVVNRLVPIQIAGLADIISVAAGRYRSLVLKSDGTVWAWGDNRDGVLGDGTQFWTSTPVRVAGLDGVKAIAAAGYHSLALKNDGTVWAWGRNFYGQLGIGTWKDSPTPYPVVGLDGVVAIAAGGDNSLALKRDGTVWGWGTVYKTIDYHPPPGPVTGLDQIIAISQGGGHGMALRNDGTVWTWGSGGLGQLGAEVWEYSKYDPPKKGFWTDSPVQVTGLENVIAIAAGDSHSLALKDDGTVWAWGHNIGGILGDGTTQKVKEAPVQVVGIADVIGIAAGTSHSIAIKKDGSLWAWGNGNIGQLGNGATANSYTPVRVSGF